MLRVRLAELVAICELGRAPGSGHGGLNLAERDELLCILAETCLACLRAKAKARQGVVTVDQNDTETAEAKTDPDKTR